MDIEDLKFRVLISLDKSLQQGKNNPRLAELAEQTYISERHIRRMITLLKRRGLIARQRQARGYIYSLTEAGQTEVRCIREYFRLS